MANRNDNKVLLQNKDWCKGCGVCVGFCPTKTLIIENDKCIIAYPEKCIYCGQCELRCPDNAIWITAAGGKEDEQ